ncbi:enoyl-CoA hydratase [Heyndrickxia sporothermodurans]|uniref:enoyl-CoA hydratase-related protein n=1 Tax=Heyndrickxia TaxID=2837504 RepID=UPI000D3C40D3|nr:enoyl-CoA hydratase-related protein [Heyndrickxia sporothermodurans]PTY78386.1 enoyl-CoA hydratase [Heyndrickxia sporothermodurans]
MKNILFEVKNYVGFVTLNREKAMNAFNYETLCELASVVESIRTNSEVRALVFLGAGEKAFSVGADLKERKTLSEQEVRRNVYKIGEVFESIANLPQPTIAAMNGYAFGGGMELALSCDFRIAVSDAVMGLTETSLAIIPGAGGTQRLPRLIGEAKAMELILTAKRMTADEAYQYGVVTKVVERARFLEEVNEFVGEIQANGPIAIQQAKFAIKNGMNVDLHTGLEIERKAYEITIPTEDRVEALQAFSEKRKPNFKGK